MTTFLLYAFAVVCLGILIRIFWIPLMVIGGILFIILGILVCAGVTAFTIEMIHALCTDGTWTGFATYFTYSTVLYTVMMLVYMAIIGDIFGMAIKFFKK
jgi:hypothetical protein